MASIYDKASLVLIPSGTKTSKVYSQKPTNGDGDFTFSRSTAATRVNASGNIEKETQNLITYSNDFSQTAWLKYLLSLTSGQSGYDGTSDAWLIEKSGAYGNVYRNISNSGVYAWSVYAKAGSFDFLALRFRNTSNNYRTAYFDLSNGTLGSVDSNIIKHTIQDVGSGWYRCQIAFNDSAINQVMIYPSDANNGINNSGTGNIYIQDAQLEQGLVARDYIETTTTAIYGGITDNVPRLDYTDSSCPALLLEPQRTNLVGQSEYFSDNSNWFKYNLGAGSLPVVTDNYADSPEGLQNAARLQLDAGGVSSSDRSRLYTTIATTNGTNYTWSFYAKSNTGNNEYIKPRAADVNYSEITITTEWQRFDVSFTANATGTFQYGFECRGNHTENSVDILIYGATLEAGSYATSYIPTYGSAVTRNNDSCYLLNATSIIGQSEGSVFVEIGEKTTESIGLFEMGQGTSQHRFFLYTDTNNKLKVLVVDNYSVQVSYTSSVNVSSGAKIAITYANNDYGIYLNGSLLHTDTSASVPPMNQLAIGADRGRVVGATANINEVLLFSTKLSNQEAIDLTTI